MPYSIWRRRSLRACCSCNLKRFQPPRKVFSFGGPVAKALALKIRCKQGSHASSKTLLRYKATFLRGCQCSASRPSLCRKATTTGNTSRLQKHRHLLSSTVKAAAGELERTGHLIRSQVRVSAIRIEPWHLSILPPCYMHTVSNVTFTAVHNMLHPASPGWRLPWKVYRGSIQPHACSKKLKQRL